MAVCPAECPELRQKEGEARPERPTSPIRHATERHNAAVESGWQRELSGSLSDGSHGSVRPLPHGHSKKALNRSGLLLLWLGVVEVRTSGRKQWGRSLRNIILTEIKRIAEANGGKPPGAQLFRSETGIGETKWRGVYWARWGDALVEAGFAANEWQQKLASTDLLRRLAELVRSHGRIPTFTEVALLRRDDSTVPSAKTLQKHFDGRAGLIAALRSYCAGRDELEDVLAILPQAIPAPSRELARVPEGWVYLLKSGQHYKIGRSDQLETRVKQISIALPEATAMVHAIRTDDPPGIEAYWHRRFADRRANGEWFKLDAADVAAFTRRKFQ